eukprot:7860020-Ditylum_brightwellii.AAC.1
MFLSKLPSPSLVINKHAFIRNCRSVLKEARRHGMRLRPHVKTHKTLEGSLIQATGADLTSSSVVHFWPEGVTFPASVTFVC